MSGWCTEKKHNTAPELIIIYQPNGKSA